MHSLAWIKSDGVEQIPGGPLSSTVGGTYYAELAIGHNASGFGVTLAPDGTVTATADVESTDFPFDPLVAATSTWSTANDCWKATTLTQQVIGAASVAAGWEAIAATARRYRVKLVVSTTGRCPGFAITKAG